MSYHGTQCKVAVKTDNTVAFGDWETTDKVQSVSFNFEGNLVDVYMLGDRDPQEIKEVAAAANAPAERANSTVKGHNAPTSGFQVSWVVDEHGATEDALVALMNVLVAKYSRKVSASNLHEIVLRETETVIA